MLRGTGSYVSVPVVVSSSRFRVRVLDSFGVFLWMIVRFRLVRPWNISCAGVSLYVLCKVAPPAEGRTGGGV